ncbi:MAG: SDR family NAD(P)-dependent oxidoreductase [Clostridia bacterium]|nr:SDR family NAD(P)-dependent oxidoreductase [Clostridia bacterium]
MNEVVILTGGTSGIGRATVQLLREKGCRVYEFSRRAAENDPNHFSVDVTDGAAVKAAVEAVFAREGRVDILINNAGFGISGAMEFTDSADAHKLMEVNLFGMDNVIRAVLPHMREAKAGRIVNISSVAGVFAIPFQAWYSISKAAVRALTMALYNEVAPFGIQVANVLPGDIKTGFTAARKKSAVGDAAYGGRIARSVEKMEKDEQNGMRPEDAAKTIVRVALQKRRVKPEYTIGFSYKLLVLLDSLLPCRLVRWLLFQLYGK